MARGLFVHIPWRHLFGEAVIYNNRYRSMQRLHSLGWSYTLRDQYDIVHHHKFDKNNLKQYSL